MPRQILNRYIYNCDAHITIRAHRGTGHQPCQRFDVIDATHEHDADTIAQQRGWRFENDQWVCNGIHQRKEALV
jgi:hypothetical protein